MTLRFREVAERVVDALLEASPEWALDKGDTRGAHLLTDYSAEADVQRAAMLTDALGSLDEIDPDLLPPGDLVDLEVLRTKVSANLWHTTELRPHTWDPLVYTPGEALLPLVERETLPLPERLAALTSRCSVMPAHLASARTRLSEGPGMPRVHVETALGQMADDRHLLTHGVPALAERDPETGPALEDAARQALEALEEHESWLRIELEVATADPRLGGRDFAAQLWYALDSELSPEALLVRAESDLLATEEAMADDAAEYQGQPRRPGQVAEVLAALAEDHPVTGEGLRSTGEQALEHLYRRTREAGIVTVHEDPVRVVLMPESRRGVAVAHCRPPGPLAPQASQSPTFIAVSPPPEDWPEEQAAFLREHNGAMLRNLMAHEGIPGHALQLAHADRHDGATSVGKLFKSDTFVEGWAVHAEEVMARHGWSATNDAEGRRQDLALRLVCLKNRLRMILSAILDVRVHTGDITEDEALSLLTERGHQGEGQAVSKWRRAQLTSAQLSTYYVGYTEMAAIARDLSEARPDLSERDVHDLMLAHGSPPPRHLRTLLGL